MKPIARIGVVLAAAVIAMGAAPQVTFGDDADLEQNQTLGFGANELLRFTYEQSFACVDQPTDDRNYNGILAQSDPAEFQTPICQVGAPSTIDPTGIAVAQSEPLYVLVPMFSLNNDQNPNDAFTPELGQTLIKLFGAVPEGFKNHPLVAVQCPDNGGSPGTCTMHASRVDLFPALSALGKVPATPKHNIFVPTPNHSHITEDDAVTTKAIWWQVITVLVMTPEQWPNAEGTSGITSAEKMRAAEASGEAIQTPTNFFLFFESMPVSQMQMQSTSAPTSSPSSSSSPPASSAPSSHPAASSAPLPMSGGTGAFDGMALLVLGVLALVRYRLVVVRSNTHI
jgi:hypothetical protein